MIGGKRLDRERPGGDVPLPFDRLLAVVELADGSQIVADAPIDCETLAGDHLPRLVLREADNPARPHQLEAPPPLLQRGFVVAEAGAPIETGRDDRAPPDETGVQLFRLAPVLDGALELVGIELGRRQREVGPCPLLGRARL